MVGALIFLCASDPETDAGILGAAAAFNDDGGYWADTAPDAVNFRVGVNNVTNGAGDRMEYLCFFDIPQFCKAFAFRGNGDGNGLFIPLDFRPVDAIIKQVTTPTTGGHWWFPDQD